MIDIAYLENIKLVSMPWMQRLIARFFLTPNYSLFAKVDIEIEGIEKIPRDKNVIFAMNHADRYNYWPFQYKLWKTKEFPFTTVWVKGKYYRNAMLAKVLDLCNLIPVPSMRYLVEEFFVKKFGRRIREEEYRALKDLMDGKDDASNSLTIKGSELAVLIHENFIEFITTYYKTIMERVAELSKEALLEKDLNLIIFPEGTRSTKLGEGKTGCAQLALNTGTPIIPVGCNYSDQIYSGNLPFAKSGRVVYRVGDPLSFDRKLKEYRIKEGFKLFSTESKIKYETKFNEVTRIVMENINRLVDKRYRK
jgi:1-acyl-sn-glycerol-3-phosphate acyltransferase